MHKTISPHYLIKSLIIIALFLYKSTAFSQVLKVNNGINISSVSAQKGKILNKSNSTYSFSLGADYLEKKHFYLSSEIGYFKKGGKEENEFLPDSYKNIKENWSYLHLNTTIRYPIKVKNNAHFFIGVGPDLNILIDSKEFNSSLYEGYELNSVVFNVKGEVGFMQDIDKIRVGLSFAYFHDISNTGKSEFNSLKNNMFQGMFTIGYRIN